jgi:hypothetical protein
MTSERIVYRDFYDVPRVFLVRYKQHLFLFESVFDAQRDDYSQTYNVYLMPELTENEIGGSWEKISQKAIRKICQVPVSDVKFDPTRRKEIQAETLKELDNVMLNL